MQTGQGQGYPNNPGSDPVNCGGMCRSSCVVFNGLTHALCWSFRTDNSGPPMDADEVDTQFAIAQWQFPGANIFASTYDNFTAQLNTVRSSLPVSTGEVGDTWMTSTTADPWKITYYREAARAYAICVQTGQCDIHDPRVIGYTRMLAKIPEHTYGFPGLDDSTHFTNDDFHSIIAAGEQAYVDCLHSYTEQRDIAAREGMRYLADHPLAANITARMAAIAPAVPDVSQLTPVDQGDWATAVSITTPGGALTLGFDGTTGAFTTFNLAGVDWADEGHLLAQYIYKTYNGGSLSQRLVLTFPAPHPSPSSRNPALATRRRLTSFCLLPHHRRRQHRHGLRRQPDLLLRRGRAPEGGEPAADDVHADHDGAMGGRRDEPAQGRRLHEHARPAAQLLRRARRRVAHRRGQ